MNGHSVTFPDTANKHIGVEQGEFWVVRNGEYIDGPYLTADMAIASLEDWELRAGEVRIVKTVKVSQTVVTHTTTWVPA